LAFSLRRQREDRVLRAGIGLYANDLAQTGWATSLQAVNASPATCVDPVTNPGGAENSGCIPGSSSGGSGNLIDSKYKAPNAIHITGGVEHSFGAGWSLRADYTHEQGNHGYRAYGYTAEQIFSLHYSNPRAQTRPALFPISTSSFR